MFVRPEHTRNLFIRWPQAVGHHIKLSLNGTGSIVEVGADANCKIGKCEYCKLSGHENKLSASFCSCSMADKSKIACGRAWFEQLNVTYKCK